MLEKKFLISSLCLVVVLGLSATATMGADILFVSSMDPNHMPGDDALKSFLEGLGHTVTYFDDDEDEATTEAAAAAADVVFISESVGSSQIETEITEIETPMIIGEPWAWDEMGLTDGGGAGTDVASTDITIVDPGHYLAAELSGTVTVLTDITSADGTARFGNGVAGSEARVIATATLSDGQTYDVIFVYEKGAALAVPPADGSPQVAADMRICFGFDYRSQTLFNENAYILLGMAVNYALGVIIPQARDPEPRDGALHKDAWVGLSWTPGDFAASHDVYLGENFVDVNNGTGGTFRGNQPEAYFVAGLFGFAYPDGLAPGVTYYWRIDEVNDLDPNSPWKGDVWSFMIPPNTAYDPDPPDGGKSVDPNVTLSWTAGLDAKLHHVYFGDNLADVNAGTGETSKGPAVVTAYTPGPLALETTYYWRVDELDGITTHKGDVWSFTTVGFSFVVDDFESYNNLDPGDPNSNRIFNAWLDGYDIPTNGSLVGYEVPPFCERTIVRSGKQAMPLSYSNTAGATYSEAERTFAVAQNWTEAGVQTLVLYFHGSSGNTGQLYVKVNGSKVVYDGDAGDIAKLQWKQWNIDLASLGVDLQNVTKLSIGIDGIGASGTLYFDDIRLYRSAPEPQAP